MKDIAYGAGYNMVMKEFDKCIRRILQMDYGLVLISHSQDVTLKDENDKQYFQNDNNKVVPLFDLIITAKIKPSKQYYISHILGYNYRHIFSMKNNEYLNQFQFDIRPRSAHLIWFSSEVDEYCYSYTRFCYTQNISSFSYNDSIQFRINLMSPVGIVSTFKWNELQSDMNIPRELYEKNILKKETEFDRFRDCEIENIVHLWKNARHYLTDERHNKKCSPLVRHKILLHSFIEIMKSNFFFPSLPQNGENKSP